MSTITVTELVQNPQSWLARVEAGEAFTVVRDGKPVAEVKPAEPPLVGLRPCGLYAGQFTVPDDFDAPLPDEDLDLFYGK